MEAAVNTAYLNAGVNLTSHGYVAATLNPLELLTSSTSRDRCDMQLAPETCTHSRSCQNSHVSCNVHYRLFPALDMVTGTWLQQLLSQRTSWLVLL